MTRRRRDGAPEDAPSERDDWTVDPAQEDRLWEAPQSRAEQERWRRDHPLEGGATYGPIEGISARPKPSRTAKVAQAGVTVGHGISKGARVVARGSSVVGQSAYRVTH